MIDTLKDYFYQLDKIEDSYRGDKTNWNEKLDELHTLYEKVSQIKIGRSKNSYFYSWIRRKLLAEIKEEIIHVRKLTLHL